MHICCQDLGRLNKRLGTATASTPADRVAELDGCTLLVLTNLADDLLMKSWDELRVERQR